MKSDPPCTWEPQGRDSFRAYEPATMADSRGERPTGRTGDSAARRAAGLRLSTADGYASTAPPPFGMAACAGDLRPGGHQHRCLPAHGAAGCVADGTFGGSTHEPLGRERRCVSAGGSSMVAARNIYIRAFRD